MMTGATSGAAAFIVSLLSFVTILPASALELAQAQESCRNSIGRPTYMACKQSGGPHEAFMECQHPRCQPARMRLLAVDSREESLESLGTCFLFSVGLPPSVVVVLTLLRPFISSASCR